MNREKGKKTDANNIDFSREKKKITEEIYINKEKNRGRVDKVDRLEFLSYGSLFVYLMREALGCGGGGS